MAVHSRKDSSNVGRKPSVTGKMTVAEPTSIGKFTVILVMHLCKKILLIDTYWKIGIYMCGITIGSLLTDLFPLPKTAYFANKSNFVNVYFVKFAWGWTCIIVGSFIYVTSNIYCCGNQQRIRNHLSRLIVGTAGWFSCTKLFDYIEHISGFCDSGVAEHSTKSICLKEGSTWLGIDVSGHAFLMIYCLLIISEEVKCINGWEKIQEVIQTEDKFRTQRMTNEQFTHMKEKYGDHLLYVRTMIVLMTIMQLTWELMLFTTTLFFHSMPQKLLGGTFAVVCWLLSYQIWFKLENVPPGPPGKGFFSYMKQD